MYVIMCRPGNKSKNSDACVTPCRTLLAIFVLHSLLSSTIFSFVGAYTQVAFEEAGRLLDTNTCGCLYVHQQMQLFLFGYVRDYKITDKIENIPTYFTGLVSEDIKSELHVPLYFAICIEYYHERQTRDCKVVDLKIENLHRLRISGAFSKPETLRGGAEAPPFCVTVLLFLPLKGPSTIIKPKRVRTREYAYKMFGHAQHTVDRYKRLAYKPDDSQRQLANPCIHNHQIIAFRPISYAQRSDTHAL